MNYANESEIADIIVHSITGEITDSDRIKLNEWIARSPENAASYEKIVSGDSYRAYRAVSDKIDRPVAQHKIAVRIRRRIMGRIAAVMGAAAAVIAAVLVFIRPTIESSLYDGTMAQEGLFVEESRQAVLSWGDASVTLTEEEQEAGWKKYVEPDDTPAEEHVEQQVQRVKIDIPFGGCYKLLLEDGTVAWLNSGSSLEYPRTFGEDVRRVVLRGEGYFEVAEDPAKPFEVSMREGLAVRVLGTKFNASTYDDLDYTTVTLIDGTVELLSLKGITRLEPNQQALFNRATLETTMREVPDAMAHAAWIHGVFDFKAEPLNEIMDALGQWYGVSITYDNNMDLEALGHFTMKVGRSEDFYSILKRLGTVTGFDYKVQGGEVYISQ